MFVWIRTDTESSFQEPVVATGIAPTLAEAQEAARANLEAETAEVYEADEVAEELSSWTAFAPHPILGAEAGSVSYDDTGHRCIRVMPVA